ncbi:uncharacterized protein [Drosophila suzukii]|uniref:Uncharacterized protein n=1 Tax=Drosophila suzukii TaxID=28584 RepID=A0AB40DE04_DROSZ
MNPPNRQSKRRWWFVRAGQPVAWPSSLSASPKTVRQSGKVACRCVCVCVPTQRSPRPHRRPPPTHSTNCFHYGKRKTQCRRFITLISKRRKRNVMTNRDYSRLFDFLTFDGDGVIVLIVQTMSAFPFLARRH